jgi:hypothetical protein
MGSVKVRPFPGDGQFYSNCSASHLRHLRPPPEPSRHGEGSAHDQQPWQPQREIHPIGGAVMGRGTVTHHEGVERFLHPEFARPPVGVIPGAEIRAPPQVTGNFVPMDGQFFRSSSGNMMPVSQLSELSKPRSDKPRHDKLYQPLCFDGFP